MLTWQDELRDALDEHPGGAERLVRAIDTDDLRNSCIRCAYAHICAQTSKAIRTGFTLARQNRKYLAATGRTRLEEAVISCEYKEIRSECILWLAEHGSVKEATMILEAESGSIPEPGLCSVIAQL